jgi:NAD(P)H-dependent FMN reductase
MTKTTVAALCGSLREDSYTRTALDWVLSEAADSGATTELVDLRHWELPVYDADTDDAGDAPELRQHLRAADTVLLGTPVYHGSYATPLKNALDYCGFDEFEDTTVGLLAVAGGSFPLTALDHLRSVCRALNAWVIPHQAAIPNVHSQFENGQFRDDEIKERVTTLGQRAVEFADIEPDPPCLESEENMKPAQQRGEI